MKRPSKISNLLVEVRKKLDSGQYIYTGHANQRLQERAVTRLEVKQVLKSGRHEKQKDEFKVEYNSWNYSIRGETVDKKNLRIAVTFNKNKMLVVTIIDLDN